MYLQAPKCKDGVIYVQKAYKDVKQEYMILLCDRKHSGNLNIGQQFSRSQTQNNGIPQHLPKKPMVKKVVFQKNNY